jgi:ATP-dependent Clp protease ATP-binding subunit ClpC
MFNDIVLLLLLCSDRFLPDKAIDLIDEAGSRVRLRHAQVLPVNSSDPKQI